MKASEFGCLPPSTVGNLMYARSEDGNGDGLWINSADSEEEAVGELEACYGDEQDHGYLADCVEATIDGPDADRIIEQVNEWAHERYGEAVEDWPNAKKEAVNVLQARLDKVFGEWLTEFNLWPSFCGIENIRRVELTLPAEQEVKPNG